MYTNFLIWLLLTPLLLSLIAFVLRWLKITSIRLAEVLHGINISLVLVFALIVLQGVLSDGHVGALNNWLLVDSLGVLFLMIIAVVGFLVGLYSIGYIRHEVETGELSEQQVHFYYALLSLFCFTMLLVVTSNNIIMMWVAVEATTLGSAFLVGIYNRRFTSLEAAWKYVMICTVGVAFGLYGTILVYSDAVNYLQEPGAAILWTAIVENAAALDPTLLKLAFVFILIGFGTKAGIFPMHAWLPDAHSESPSPVSALLSAALIKMRLTGHPSVCDYPELWSGSRICSKYFYYLWYVISRCLCSLYLCSERHKTSIGILICRKYRLDCAWSGHWRGIRNSSSFVPCH